MPHHLVADLHTHSTASDGCLSASEIVHAAIENQLECIAITDHDSLDGSKSALELVSHSESHICIVPGVEISTQVDGRDVHMLGYFMDMENRDLNEFFEANRKNREKRACAVADNMAQDGYPVCGQDMIESGKTINRTLLARMLVERGIAHSVDDAYDRLIGKSSKYYVENVRYSAFEAIELIRQASGFAFVAHPALYKVTDLIPSFKDAGMAGLEAYHTLQTPSQSAALVALAHEEGLGISGGSDWHGDDTHGASLMSAGLSLEQLSDFLRCCEAQ